jgi:D-cysteine desulfhydrase
MIPLFEHFPRLKENLPYVSVGEFPTPVKKLDKMGEKLGLAHLYVKQDGFTGKPFGGNKVRKLEFVLGEALRRGAKEVLTFGYAGSNHALATAVYAKQLGLKSISMLLPQHTADYVRRNLLMSLYCEAELHHCPNRLIMPLATLYQQFRHRLKEGKYPYLIPPGGSTPAGTIGFVNAAFELKNQIDRGEVPEPDRIYVTLGTSGTVVGLMIGLKALGIKSRVIPVRVVDKKWIDENSVLTLYTKTITLLCTLAPSFPRQDLSVSDIRIDDDFLGKGYAQFTDEGNEAVSLMEEVEGITLDGTYTGKTFAALIADAREKKIKDEIILFWNTLNTGDVSGLIEGVDYRRLPKPFHRYFNPAAQGAEDPAARGAEL